MNAVEIEAAVSELASAPYDAAEFPFQFLAAFDRKEATLKRLRKGDTNKSDVAGAYLLTGAIHIATCATGETRQTLDQLRDSSKTLSARAKFIFVTDGAYFEAEDVSATQEPVADFLSNLANHFGFFLPLAGISTVREIKDNPIDIRATGRLNKLYVELLRINPDWASAARRHDMNHFMARLIFCFFAEDTHIFPGISGLFTSTIEQFTESDGSNVSQVVGQCFRAMNLSPDARLKDHLTGWADRFPYVNGGLFGDTCQTPNFNRIARSYLIQAGNLNWQQINPDIFGSMIQAVADDEERGALGMHYTSVPNILKVLSPLFLDDLRAQLETAGVNPRLLRNLRHRLGRIRVFDPACGSGNFLVIAYKQMRSIESEVDRRLEETPSRSAIPLNNFRGIELRDFAVEIARLSLVIAEYQCNVQHLGEQQAQLIFLPLALENWIVCDNALQTNWMQLCPPQGTGVRRQANDLFGTMLEQPTIDFENEGGEIYICGNPPYVGSVRQTDGQKEDLRNVFDHLVKSWRSLDYVAGWLMKAASYAAETLTSFAFVATNSICQGEQVAILWPLLFESGHQISFAHTSFKWSNLASNKAGVTVVIVGMSKRVNSEKLLYDSDLDGELRVRRVANINPYLVASDNTIVQPISSPISEVSKMHRGNLPNDGGHLLLTKFEARALIMETPAAAKFIKKFVGAREFVGSTFRYCLWIEDDDLEEAKELPPLLARLAAVAEVRSQGGLQAQAYKKSPHKFVFAPHRSGNAIEIPAITSENRDYLPVGLADEETIIGAKCYVMYDAPIWSLALIASRLHWMWVGTVCVRMRTDFSYSNTLGWNTFPAPSLTEQNKGDLTRCAEDILLAREAHFPATIADLYDHEKMPADLRAAHDANDEVLERIYIGRRFRNDTERLEKLFEMYTKMTATSAIDTKPAKRTKKATV